MFNRSTPHGYAINPTSSSRTVIHFHPLLAVDVLMTPLIHQQDITIPVLLPCEVCQDFLRARTLCRGFLGNKDSNSKRPRAFGYLFGSGGGPPLGRQFIVVVFELGPFPRECLRGWVCGERTGGFEKRTYPDDGRPTCTDAEDVWNAHTDVIYGSGSGLSNSCFVSFNVPLI